MKLPARLSLIGDNRERRQLGAKRRESGRGKQGNVRVFSEDFIMDHRKRQDAIADPGRNHDKISRHWLCRISIYKIKSINIYPGPHIGLAHGICRAYFNRNN